jgi:DNA polymerase I-like protein with 3'-5' exonuclease and polymerase domains
LAAYRAKVEAELSQIASDFRDRFVSSITQLEQSYLESYVGRLKTEKGQNQAWLRAVENPEEVSFNVGSTHHLADLFIGKLGMTPRFMTEKGTPTFKAAFLDQWGDGGLMLKKRRTKLIALKQTEALLALSEHDGRWHVDLRACGTVTGRYSGGTHG